MLYRDFYERLGAVAKYGGFGLKIAINAAFLFALELLYGLLCFDERLREGGEVLRGEVPVQYFRNFVERNQAVVEVLELFGACDDRFGSLGELFEFCNFLVGVREETVREEELEGF